MAIVFPKELFEATRAAFPGDPHVAAALGTGDVLYVMRRIEGAGGPVLHAKFVVDNLRAGNVQEVLERAERLLAIEHLIVMWQDWRHKNPTA